MKFARKAAFVSACLLAAGIWAVAPIGRAVRAAAMPLLSEVGTVVAGNFWIVLGSASALSALGLVAWARLRGWGQALTEWLALVATASFAWFFIGRPEEFSHIVEYGILGYLAGLGIQGRRILPVIFCGSVSLGDEFIQYLTPDRFADVRDLAINFLGALMGQILSLPCDSALDRRSLGRSS